ncbi:MAG: isoprenoid biosynthesis glyoxalase ElbB [Myxococcota bacterium]|nr:isoprenoid biosynthesis glyoxalase ElbB [Myxococcota bacterium]MEE2778974.1 isoprenoid biosynthesis glyoxalase ElbB [Myxococcota bacterium]
MSEGTGKKVGVVLSGCGVNDGAEIHEATLTLLSLDRAGAQVVAMAPNVAQMHVVDHVAGAPADGEQRNVLVESARIARGAIRDMAEVDATELDALVFPGGFGAAKNLCSFAVDGASMTVNPDVDRLIKQMVDAKKPLGFICIAPVIAAKVLGELSPRLTIGNDEGTAGAMESLGATHVESPVEEAVVDQNLKIVSTPAYMLGPSIAPVASGIENLVEEVLRMA